MEIYKVISKEQVNKLSLEQLYDIMAMHLRYNDYNFVSTNQIKYKNGDNVEGLEYILHQCPDCSNEFSMRSNKNTLYCSNCNYTAKANKYGLLSLVKGTTHYKKPSDWYLDMQSILSNKIKQTPDYSFSANGKILMIGNKRKFVEVGYGNVTINKKNIILDGTINNKAINKILNTASYPLLPFKPGQYIELQKDLDIYRIHFDNPFDCSKFNMILKELNQNKN